MAQRTVLLMVTALALGGIVSGCSAIGFVGGTIIDNTFTEEKALEVPTAEQIRDSSVALPRGETILIETTSGEECEGVYAGTRVVPVIVEVKDLERVLTSGYATVFEGDFDRSNRSISMVASRKDPKSQGGPVFASAVHEGSLGRLPLRVIESSTVTVSAHALLLLSDNGPLSVPVFDIKGITTTAPKTTTMRLVLLGAITDLMLLQGALGLMLIGS